MSSGRAALLGALALAACAPTKGPEVIKAATPVDLERYRAELLQIDRDFAAAAREKGLDGWVSFLAEDAVQIPRRHALVIGREAIRAFMKPAFADPTTMLVWDPDRADVAKGGDFGYTTGRAWVVHLERGGKETVMGKMKYVTVWKRQPDGSWKVALDVGSED